MVGLGDLPGGGHSSIAWGVSNDGTVVVGTGMNEAGNRAFRWTDQSGMESLGSLPDGSWSWGYGVSANGDRIVGKGAINGGAEAFMWTAETGMVGLGDLPGGTISSEARAISPEGSVIVGQGLSAIGYEAFRWTEMDGMVSLGDLSGGTVSAIAYGVSQNGTIVVGSGNSDRGQEAFIWDAVHGMRSLQSMLIQDFGLGNQLADWHLNAAFSITPDGTTIVGDGVNPEGHTEAFRVVIPEPASALFLSAAMKAILIRRRRRLW